MSLTWPDHLLTLQEWEAVPDQPGVRIELAEGVLMMSPKPLFGHQLAMVQVASGLNQVLPRDLVALSDVEVVVSDPPLTIRVPDIVVMPTAAYGSRVSRIAASQVLLAVEILSDGTRRVDRILKFAEYAEAGIPQYCIADIGEPTTLLAYTLADGTYELSAEVSGRAVLDIAGHPVELDLDALARR